MGICKKFEILEKFQESLKFALGVRIILRAGGVKEKLEFRLIFTFLLSSSSRVNPDTGRQDQSCIILPHPLHFLLFSPLFLNLLFFFLSLQLVFPRPFQGFLCINFIFSCCLQTYFLSGVSSANLVILKYAKKKLKQIQKVFLSIRNPKVYFQIKKIF